MTLTGEFDYPIARIRGIFFNRIKAEFIDFSEFAGFFFWHAEDPNMQADRNEIYPERKARERKRKNLSLCCCFIVIFKI